MTNTLSETIVCKGSLLLLFLRATHLGQQTMNQVLVVEMNVLGRDRCHTGESLQVSLGQWGLHQTREEGIDDLNCLFLQKTPYSLALNGNELNEAIETIRSLLLFSRL